MSFKSIIAAAAIIGTVAAAYAADISGAGATFPFPIYAKWADSYKKETGAGLNYQSIGSGAGIKQIRAKTVTFGATDAPLKAEDLDKDGLAQWPMVMGGIVMVVNIPGVKSGELVLDGPTVAQIYMGKITKWNDPAIAKLNPGLKLPDLAIANIHRADGSGTTFVFSSYLSAVSPEWKSKVGANTSVNWPAGAGAKGNDGVAATTHNTRGGIGYVENAYATQNHLITAQLRNKAGHFVEPTIANFSAAAANGDWANAKDYAVSLIDLPGDDSWPIVSTTFIELPKDPKDPARSANVMKFFDWAYSKGDSIASRLEYIALPDPVKAAVRSAWRSEIKGPDGKSVL